MPQSATSVQGGEEGAEVVVDVVGVAEAGVDAVGGAGTELKANQSS